MRHKDRVFFVAGVGPGLGSALVSLLASEGAGVMALARSAKALGPIRAHAERRGWNVDVRTADVLNQAEVDRAVAQGLEHFGRLDGVSINVGRWHGAEHLLHQMSDEEWSDGIRGNLEPTFRVARATVPHLIAQGGGSVVIVSAAAAIRAAGNVPYHLAKGALVDVVPRLARDYRPWKVRVNAVLPGSMRQALDGLDPPAPEHRVPLAEDLPTSPWEVARAVQYLLSDESRWVTGALLTVDGGLSAGGAESPPK